MESTRMWRNITFPYHSLFSSFDGKALAPTSSKMFSIPPSLRCPLSSSMVDEFIICKKQKRTFLDFSD